MGFKDRIEHAWNAFIDNERKENYEPVSYATGSYGSRQDRVRRHISNERSIISAIYTRIAVDVASIAIKHVRVDENGKFLEGIHSGLNRCLSVEANRDQAGRAFRQDMAMSLCDNGSIAIVPVDVSVNPEGSGGYDIKTLRVGEIVAWYPEKVRISLYNENKGKREELVVSKNFVAIVENPLYSVMNETNSTLQRLLRKLNLLDAIDEQSGSGKLDIIIQLPYTVKSDLRKNQAEERRTAIETQLKNSKYGIAYADSTEKITQLNRPAENNMLNQVEYLTKMLYGQLGITEEVINGTADEATMLNYYNRTLEPILTSISEAMKRTFLTKTAITQNQSILFFREPFKLVPISNLAEIADKLTRNEILSSNEIRGILGYQPVKDKKADQLVNSNLPQNEGKSPEVKSQITSESETKN